MSYAIDPVNLSAAVVGQIIPIPFADVAAYGSPLAGSQGQRPSLVLQNESGVGLLVTLPRTNLTFPLPAGAWTQPIPIDPGEVSASAKVLYVLNNQPVSLLVGVYYGENEQPVNIATLGNSPIGLSTGVPVTASVTQVIQDGQAVGQIIVEATPTDGIQHVLVTTDGHETLKGALAQFQVIPDTTGGNDTVVRLGPDPHSLADWQFIITSAGDLVVWDNKNFRNVGIFKLASGGQQLDASSNAFTDGSGDLTVQQVMAVNGYNFGAGNAWFMGSSSSTTYDLWTKQSGGVQQVFIFHNWDGAAGHTPFGVGTGAQGTTPAWVDDGGTVHSSSPMFMRTGRQESGKVGVSGFSSGPSAIGVGCNFKTTMTNTPSSVTLTADQSSGISNGPNVLDLGIQGFHLRMLGPVSGFVEWLGGYTTVGNCIRSVDAAAKTFAHHCDGCETVREAVPFSELELSHPDPHATGAGHYGVSYHCPCGTTEAFNTGLSLADELADVTGHSTLVNQLLEAMGLPAPVTAATRAQLASAGGI